MKRNVKLFSGILIILIVAILSFFMLLNNSQEVKPIKDANDLSKSYYDLKQKDFINVLYVQSDTRFNGSSIYNLYIKDRNNFTVISNKCNENLDVRVLGTEEIKEDDFFAGVHAFPYYYSYEVEYFKQPEIKDNCFETNITKNNETNIEKTCFDKFSGIISNSDSSYNSTNVETMRFFNSTELNFSSSRVLVYTSFKEESPEDIIKNNNPCKK